MSETVKSMVEGYQDSKEKLDFFDINCWWDVSDFRSFHRVESFEQYMGELKSHGIKKAVLTNAECVKSDPYAGNENAVELIKNYDNLFGCMVLAPDISDGVRHIQNYIGKMTERKFVAARMFPKTLRHSMNKWAVGEILAHMNERRLPLILWHNEVSWDLVEGLCREYKNLPVIVEGNDVKLLYHNRNYVFLMEKYGNFYLETFNVIIFSEIDWLAKNICSERLLFGSYFPYNAPDASMSPIAYAALPDDAKGLMAGRNLERLVKGIK